MTSGNRWADPELVHERYSRSSSRGTTIYEFRRPDRDWIAHLTGYIDWEPTWTALDAGCGPGNYFDGLRRRVPDGAVIALDFTLTQLAETAHRHPSVPLVNGDVQALPLADARVDVIVCAHMLYHVPDIPAAIREFRRVLRPGGALLAVYDSAVDDQKELDDLFVASGGRVPLNQITNLFSIESGPGYLEPVFDSVELKVERPSMVVPDVDAVVDEIDGLRAVAEDWLEPGVTWEEMIAGVRQRVTEVVERDGAFTITEHKGVFICR